MKLIKHLLLLTILITAPLNAREAVNITFDNLQISKFIQLVAKITDTNILVSNKINGTVDLVTAAPIYEDELLGILVSVLEAKGFTLIKKGSLYEVVRSTEAAKHNVPVVRSGYIARGHTMVTQAIKVEGENVDIVAAKVRYLISKTAKLMTMKESNTLLLTDYPANIQTIKRIIKDIDTKSEKVIEIIPIKHADLKALHVQVANIAKSIFNEKVATQNVQVLLNQDVNGLILIGNKRQVEELAAVVATLDNEQDLNEVVQILPLKNSDAKNVMATLTEIITKQTFADPTMKPNVSANEEINAIILVGNPSILKGLIKIIDTLDKEKFQVYVQARIVEINKSDAEQIGIKYSLAGITSTASGLLAFSGNFGGSSGLIESALSIVGSDAINGGMAIGASLDFLQTKGASKTVSSPSILCVNNQESSIYVGKTLSFQTGSNTAGTLGTTSSFKREDVGLTLKIKPRVSSADKVTLDAETILENVLPVTDTNNQPVTTKQTVLTQAILRHGESIIIGGLVKNYITENETKVPILGYIPLLGWFFTHTDTQDQQDNLIVILTPYIIDKSEKLSQLQKELGELSRLQAEYNKKVFEKIEKKAKIDAEVTEGNVPVMAKSIEQTGELIVEEDVEEVFEDPEVLKEPDYTTTTQQKSTGTPTPTKTKEKQVLKPEPIRPSGEYDAKSKRVVETQAPKTAASGQYYIQVGSFTKHAPSKTFLDKIANRGYTYTFHNVTSNGKTLNKVLVGPFKTHSAAREALPVIKRSVESGAYLIKR
ncbi:MAG: secretin N-terminal domain-containing protein [Sulfurimonadaceae bacterium]